MNNGCCHKNNVKQVNIDINQIRVGEMMLWKEHFLSKQESCRSDLYHLLRSWTWRHPAVGNREKQIQKAHCPASFQNFDFQIQKNTNSKWKVANNRCQLISSDFHIHGSLYMHSIPHTCSHTHTIIYIIIL